MIPFKFKLASVMVLPQCLLPGFSQQILTECASRHSIVFKNKASPAEFREKKLDDILKGAGVANVGHVETIHICFVNPLREGMLASLTVYL